MRINELSIPSSRNDAQTILNRAGYKKLGEGGFGGVFRKPGANYVLKLFDSYDQAYVAYVDLVRAHQNNPHFPKIYGKTVRVTPEYFAVRLEILTPFKGNPKIISAISMYMKHRDTQFEVPSYGPLENAKKLLDREPQLREACDLIIDNLKDRFYLDVSRIQNFMVRKKTLVFTDPVAIRQ